MIGDIIYIIQDFLLYIHNTNLRYITPPVHHYFNRFLSGLDVAAAAAWAYVFVVVDVIVSLSVFSRRVKCSLSSSECVACFES